MSKLIGCARVSTRQQSTDRQRVDLLAAGVRRDHPYIDQGVSGVRAPRPELDQERLMPLWRVTPSSSRLWTGSGDPPKTCSRLPMNSAVGAPPCAPSTWAEGDVDTATPMDSMLRREAGTDLGGRPRLVTDSQIRSAVRLVKGGEPAAQVAGDLGMSRAAFYRRSRALAD